MRSEDILDNPCALQIVLYISECIDAGDPAPRVKDIAKQCYISRGHVSKLVKQLAAQKYVIKAGRRWRGLDIPVSTVEAMRSKGYEIMKVTRERQAALSFQRIGKPQPEESVRGNHCFISGSQLRGYLRSLAQSDDMPNVQKDIDLMLARQQKAREDLDRAMSSSTAVNASLMSAMATEAKKAAQRLAMQGVANDLAKSAALEISRVREASKTLVEAREAASRDLARSLAALEAARPHIDRNFAAMNKALIEVGKVASNEVARSIAALDKVKWTTLHIDWENAVSAAALYRSVR